MKDNIRNRNEFIETFTRKSYVKTVFFRCVTDDWNALDHGTRINDGLSSLKHPLKLTSSKISVTLYMIAISYMGGVRTN